MNDQGHPEEQRFPQKNSDSNLGPPDPSPAFYHTGNYIFVY